MPRDRRAFVATDAEIVAARLGGQRILNRRVQRSDAAVTQCRA
jgi:hypothetical protein